MEWSEESSLRHEQGMASLKKVCTKVKREIYILGTPTGTWEARQCDKIQRIEKEIRDVKVSLEERDTLLKGNIKQEKKNTDTKHPGNLS